MGLVQNDNVELLIFGFLMNSIYFLMVWCPKPDAETQVLLCQFQILFRPENGTCLKSNTELWIVELFL